MLISVGIARANSFGMVFPASPDRLIFTTNVSGR